MHSFQSSSFQNTHQNKPVNISSKSVITRFREKLQITVYVYCARSHCDNFECFNQNQLLHFQIQFSWKWQHFSGKYFTTRLVLVSTLATGSFHIEIEQLFGWSALYHTINRLMNWTGIKCTQEWTQMISLQFMFNQLCMVSLVLKAYAKDE